MLLHASLSFRELSTFAMQLSRLTRQEMPIPRALDVLGSQAASRRIARLARDARNRVEKGESLRDALSAAQPRVPEMLPEAVEAAEAAGSLSDVLQSLGNHYRDVAELRSRVWTAALYPFVVGTATVGILYAVTRAIIPQFETMFKEMGVEMPGLTIFMIKLSKAADHVGLIACIGAALVAAVFVCAMLLKRNVGARFSMERFVLALPLIGLLRQSSQIGRLCGMLGILLEAEVPERRATELAGRSAGGPVMQAAGVKMRVQLDEGRPISEALLADRVFPRSLIWMLQVGERRGNLPETFGYLAASFYRRARIALAGIEAIVPAAFLLTVLPFVAMSVCSLFLPLIKLMGSMGG